MSPPLRAPEDRWRRTIEQRGRHLKLKADRLFNEFGIEHARPGAGEEIESRLERVGLRVRPPLDDVSADQVVTLEIAERVAEPDDATAREEVEPSRPERAPQRVEETPLPPEPGLDDLEQSTLVRAALEAERRVRNAYDRAAAAAAERVAALERELVAARAATTRARDERDELERRMHGERRAAATRQQALAAAERTARGLLEAQRAQLLNLTQTLRVSTTAIAQTRETLDEVHLNVQQTAVDVRKALTESTPGEGELEPIAFDPPPPLPPEPAAAEPAPQQLLEEPAFDEPEAGEAVPAFEFEAEARPAEDTAERPAVDEPAGRPFAESAAPAPDAADVPAPQPGRESETQHKRGLGFARRRRRVSLACAMCGRSGKARDPKQLADAGWHVEGEVALCLTCVADDWTIDDGETVRVRSPG